VRASPPILKRPLRFLRTAYEPDDWIAIFLKSYETGRAAQRVGPLSLFLQPRFHAWLRAMGAQRFNVYVACNAIRPSVRARTKEAIGAVRHVFVEADQDGPRVLAAIAARSDLPAPSYVLESSPNRVHVLWRVVGLTPSGVEHLQKYFPGELGTDPAPTPCSQTTRLPGGNNHKYDPPHLVTVEHGHSQVRYLAADFPTPPARAPVSPPPRVSVPFAAVDVVERARRYLARVEPAIAGQHGDLHTFRVCFRIARGFGLSDDEALSLLAEWNLRCVPPWSERELRDKINRARKYGREPVGQLARRAP